MNENKLLGLAWISPYIIGLIVFTAFPFVSSFFLSFTEYDDESAGYLTALKTIAIC